MKPKEINKSISLNKEQIKEQAVSSLRSSFAFEGIYFTDQEIEEMVKEVHARRTSVKA